ncbi:hypothetical protein BJX61DRAFT_527240 [Aspergillus egyptiacus]|nr:hypothetical protein BJX61DRAFT_527240 [Aspergillus egyptiacus]
MHSGVWLFLRFLLRVSDHNSAADRNTLCAPSRLSPPIEGRGSRSNLHSINEIGSFRSDQIVPRGSLIHTVVPVPGRSNAAEVLNTS